VNPRGCLTSLVAFVAIVLVVLWFALPPVVGGLAAGALSSVGFNGTDTRVEVAADPPLRLLLLEADRVHVRSSSLSIRNIRADSVDLTLRDVSIGARRFGFVEGTLIGVRITPDEGSTVEAREVQIAGPAEAARVTMTLDAADVKTLVSSAVARGLGLSAGRVTLASPDLVTVALPNATMAGRFVVNGTGDLVLQPAAGGPLLLLGTGPDQPIRLQSAQVAGDALEVAGVLDLRQ
jgi:hypothetical protein